MSYYAVKGKGWRYDFTLKGQRYTEAWFKTKKEAIQAEGKKREELNAPQIVQETMTDMDFFELVSRRLDYLQAYNSAKHYGDCRYMAKRWVKSWSGLPCSGITGDMVQQFILGRNETSAFAANKEIRCLRALFNFGMKKKLVTENPVNGIEFLPVEKRVRYI